MDGEITIMETQSIEELLDSPGLVIELWRKPTNETLQTICEPFDESEFGPRLEQFGLQMIKTMKDKRGAGLAGPQVGLVKRIFVMMFPDHEQNNPIVCVNPELKLSGKDWAANEGCLSAPGVRGLVRRKYNAVMTYRTPLGKHEELELDNVDARVVQHEHDHLEGIMFWENMQDRAAAKVLEQYFKWRNN